MIPRIQIQYSRYMERRVLCPALELWHLWFRLWERRGCLLDTKALKNRCGFSSDMVHGTWDQSRFQPRLHCKSSHGTFSFTKQNLCSQSSISMYCKIIISICNHLYFNNVYRGAPYLYRKEKVITHELFFSWLSWLAVLLVGTYARRRRSHARWRSYSS